MPVTTSEFVTTDPERAHAFMREAYCDNVMRISGGTGGFRMRHAVRAAAGLSAARMDHTMAVEHIAQPLGALLVSRVLTGGIKRDTAGHSGRYGAGDLFLIAEPDRPYTVRWQNISLAMTTVDSRALAGVLGDGAGPPRFAGLQPVSAAAVRALRAALEFTATTLANPAAAGNPLVAGAAGRLLAATVLAAFPNDAAGQATWPAEGRDATAGTLARAVDFIEANPDLDIGVADIARAASVTVRTVQLAFRRHLDTTPMAYLRRVRMDRIRAELRQARPADGATVTAIAARWGFLDASRFAARYHAAYGELPRDTLRR